MFRSVLAAALACAVAVVPSAQGAPTPPKAQRHVVFVERVPGATGPGFARIEITATSSRSVVVLASTVLERDQDGAPVDAYFSDVLEVGHDAGPRTYGGAGNLLCPPGTTCATQAGPGSVGYGLQVTDNGPHRDAFVFAVEAETLKVEFSGVGYQRTVRREGFRRLSAEQRDVVGAAHLTGAAGVFRSADLPGGRRGSIAFATPPCGTWWESAAGGAGAGTLTAGAESWNVACLNSGVGGTGLTPFTEVTPTGAGWTLSGEFAGTSALRTRLLVIDL